MKVKENKNKTSKGKEDGERFQGRQGKEVVCIRYPVPQNADYRPIRKRLNGEEKFYPLKFKMSKFLI